MNICKSKIHLRENIYLNYKPFMYKFRMCIFQLNIYILLNVLFFLKKVSSHYYDIFIYYIKYDMHLFK